MNTEKTPEKPIVKTFPVGPLQCNCTVIGNPETGEAIVVDPGGDHQKILAVISEMGCNPLKIKQILHTHAHFDHFLASGQMKKASNASLCLHRADEPLWNALETQCGMYNIPFEPVPPPDHWLSHEEDLPFGGECRHTPGHTPGSASFWFKELNLLVAGDTLFKRSIGRTDLWGGDYAAIEKSIKTRLYTLDETATVVTGHGPSTILGDEMRHNQFVRAGKN